LVNCWLIQSVFSESLQKKKKKANKEIANVLVNCWLIQSVFSESLQKKKARSKISE